MLGKLRDHLFPGSHPAAGSAQGSSGGAPRPAHIPNLYPVGNSTIETYFRRLLAPGSVSDNPAFSGGPRDVSWLQDLVHGDVVAGAIYLAKVAKDGTTLPQPDDFIPTLTRCITSTFETVRFADEYMEEGTGVSALKSPHLLQILVAVALKHRNKDLLKELLRNANADGHDLCCRPPEPNMFRLAVAQEPSKAQEVFSSVLNDPYYGRQTWNLLVSTGWADPLIWKGAEDIVSAPATNAAAATAPPDADVAYEELKAAATLSQTDPESALARLDGWIRRGLDPQPYTGSLLDAFASFGTGEMVARFLPLVSRSLYDGIPPHSRWPGEPSLVTKAAARSDAHGLGALQALVDLGGLDVNVRVWYKAGPDDEHPQALVRSKLLPDGSHADDPPLLAAVHAGNATAVAYLLSKGAKDVGEAVERAVLLKDEAILVVLGAWKKQEHD